MLLLFLLTAAAVVAIYLLRPPPRAVVVPSTYLWRRLMKTERPLRERLRFWLSLLLALLTALALAAGLSLGPWFGGQGAQKHQVLIDNGPTMGALLEGRSANRSRTRLDQAKAEALQLLQGVEGQVLVADTAGTIHPLSYVDRYVAEELIQSLKVDYRGHFRLPELPDDPGDPAAVHYITDGVLTVSPPPGSEIISVFEKSQNAGITSFSARQTPSGQNQLFVEVLHTAEQSDNVDLEIRDSRQELRLRKVLEMEAGELWSGAVDTTGWPAGIATASVALSSGIPDALAADDVVHLKLAPSGRVRALLVASKDSPLVPILSQAERVALRRIGPGDFERANRGDGFFDNLDVLIFDSYAPVQPAPKPSILFAPPPRDWLPVVGSASRSWTAAPQKGGEIELETHPITRGLTLDRAQSIRLRKLDELGKEAAATPGLIVLAERNGDPLVATLSGNPNTVLFTFETTAGGFAFEPELAVATLQATDWLLGRAGLGALKPGTHRLDGLSSLGRWTLERTLVAGRTAQRPDQERKITEVPTASGALLDLPEPGIYRQKPDTASGNTLSSTELIVNLTSRVASQINHQRLAEPAGPVANDSPERSWNWRIFALLGLFLVLLEWSTFHRRITI